MDNKASSLVEDYGVVEQSYKEYTTKIHELANSLIQESNIQIHSISSRTKGIDNLDEKVKRKGKKYAKLSNVTDLSGIRIICYFSDQVDEVAKIIENNFLISNESSIDKRKTLDPDKFGYLSLHFVAKLSDERSKLLEYKRFKYFECEIQIRSILQHAWAEIEHDLGYKSSIEIPRDVKRRFYRLAGLLELADDEFKRIKDDIELYSAEIDVKIVEKPGDILIDKVSLEHFISNSLIVNELSETIALNVNAKLKNTNQISYYVKQMAYLNIETIDDLEKSIVKNKENITFFAKNWMSVPRDDFEMDGVWREPIDRAIPLLYLGYVLVGATQDCMKIIKYLHSVNMYVVDYDETAKEILEEFNRIPNHGTKN